jgi:Uma2 family endonuclease
MMRVSEAEYKRLAAERPDKRLELHCGVLRSKPTMTTPHNWTARRLTEQLWSQLDRKQFDVVLDQARVRRSASRYYIPDLFVVPMEYVRRAFREQYHELEAYRDPLPLVVEVWSPSTGTYDIESKLPQYMARGDLEIWYIHPYQRTLPTWRRQSDGSYTETLFTEGTIQPVALPDVTIELAPLFELE